MATYTVETCAVELETSDLDAARDALGELDVYGVPQRHDVSGKE